MTSRYETKDYLYELEARHSSTGRIVRFVKRARKVESDGEDLLRLDAKISQAVERLQIATSMEVIKYELQQKDNETRRHADDQKRELHDILRPVHEALYASHAAPPGCLDGTRTDLLDDILEWAVGDSPQRICWLSGMAGTGKSAVAQSISSRIAEWITASQVDEQDCDTRLLTFFIDRDIAARRSPLRLLHTLVYFLARAVPAFRTYVHSTLADLPEILSRALQEQVAALLVQPLSRCAEVSDRIIIVIDAFDECDKLDVREGGDLLPCLLSTVVQSCLQLRLLVTSRAERSITNTFADPLLDGAYLPRTMSSSAVQQDIEAYLTHHLPRMQPDTIRSLSRKADGLFIYAATVVRFVKLNEFYTEEELLPAIIEPDRSLRPSCLGTPAPDYTPLDDMYLHILRSALPPGGIEQNRDVAAALIRSVIASLVLSLDPLSPQLLARLLGRREEQIDKVLKRLYSVLSLQRRHQTWWTKILTRDPQNDIQANCVLSLLSGATQIAQHLHDDMISYALYAQSPVAGMLYVSEFDRSSLLHTDTASVVRLVGKRPSSLWKVMLGDCGPDAVAVSGDGRLFASASTAGSVVDIWDGASGARLAALGGGSKATIGELHFSADGSRLVGRASHRGRATGLLITTFFIWKRVDSKAASSRWESVENYTVPGHFYPTPFALSADARCIAFFTANSAGYKVLRVTTLAPPRTVIAEHPWFDAYHKTSLALSRDASLVAVFDHRVGLLKVFQVARLSQTEWTPKASRAVVPAQASIHGGQYQPVRYWIEFIARDSAVYQLRCSSDHGRVLTFAVTVQSEGEGQPGVDLEPLPSSVDAEVVIRWAYIRSTPRSDTQEYSDVETDYSSDAFSMENPRSVVLTIDGASEGYTVLRRSGGRPSHPARNEPFGHVKRPAAGSVRDLESPRLHRLDNNVTGAESNWHAHPATPQVDMQRQISAGRGRLDDASTIVRSSTCPPSAASS
ncbi:hypothetical protein EXIGLDRAFT_809094 [Exidia glandulosa HHB12029]|uniref:NACHT domain-containing protein n=1 Tax=Exidia glandulosa HHB12029 TaxID=1314781 RepID=A0A165Q2G0_EXIGL|nr:hypothetical protein EXIGLDRAFT_809094 [Exidia glandulosa HHB12029]